MVTFSRSDELKGAQLVQVDLRGARFVEADLSGVVMRGVEVADLDIDSPWLSEGNPLRVNGVDVAPLVEAELGLVDRAAAMPPGTVDESVDGEWSFAQTLRHLVLATDAWLGRSVLELDQPFHPVGLPYAGAEDDGVDTSIFVTEPPPYDEVLEVRAQRVAMVGDFLATVTPGELASRRRSPWAPDHPETTLTCLHVILNEEWEHHRYAVRDLDAIAAAGAGRPDAGGS